MDVEWKSRGWDKRSWVLGSFLGTVAGVLVQVGNGTVQAQIEKKSHGGSLYNALIGTSITIPVIVGPAIMSATANKFMFLWGFLPVIVFFGVGSALGSIIPDTTPSGSPVSFQEDCYIILLLLGCICVCSGPISYVRYQRRRARAQASKAAFLGDTASLEGVWPPAPRRTAIDQKGDL